MFADDTNVFASANNFKMLQTLVNFELNKVKEWCNVHVNKLSINMPKTSKKEYVHKCPNLKQRWHLALSGQQWSY